MARRPVEIAPNTVIAERYELESLLGEGGMGVVWAAKDRTTEVRVALKFLRGGAATSELTRKRFLREARAAMSMDHPNIVKIREVVYAPDGAPVMVMDLLLGESLGARLERESRLGLREFARIYLTVVSAVGTAHAAGIVHRDLKPDNIFLVPTAAGEVDVRVLDFGIAKLTATEGEAKATAGLTTEGAMLGTPYYMSPEQVFGDKDVDHRADIWALGVILYECLAGQKPFDGDAIGSMLRAITSGTVTPLAKVCPNVPADIAALCDRMLALEKNQRPSDLREVDQVMRRYTDVAVAQFAAATLPEGYQTFVGSPTLDSGSGADNPVSRTIAPRAGRRVAIFAGAAIAIAAGLLGLQRFALKPSAGGGVTAQPAAIAANALRTAEPHASAAAPLAASDASAPAASPKAPKLPAAKIPSIAVSAMPVSSSAPAKLPGGLAGEAPF